MQKNGAKKFFNCLKTIVRKDELVIIRQIKITKEIAEMKNKENPVDKVLSEENAEPNPIRLARPKTIVIDPSPKRKSGDRDNPTMLEIIVNTAIVNMYKPHIL